jgi:hypothetical protein
MSQTVATTVVLTSVNHVSEEDADDVMESYDADSLQEVADEMGEQVEALLAKRVFGDADDIPILDVDADVYEDWDEDKAVTIEE